MGILRSVALGKSRKSAGELTFYNRIGVACFRQKPAKSPGYKSTVPQRMQQSVFKFIKANTDAAGLKSFIDMFYDAKPRKGKSETKMNMFYKTFLPHLVAEKMAIYELPQEDLVNNDLFLGNGNTNQNRLTKGLLGVFIPATIDAAKMTVSSVMVNSIVDKANTMLSSGDTPYTINNMFVGVFGAKTGSDVDYIASQPVNVIPTLTDGIYSFDLTTVAAGLDITKQAYIVLMVGGVTVDGALDLTRRKFATDSVPFLGSLSPVVTATLGTGTRQEDGSFTMSIAKSAFDDAGVATTYLDGAKVPTVSGSDPWRIVSSSASGEDVVLTCQIDTGYDNYSVKIVAVPQQAIKGDSLLAQFTNGYQFEEII